MNTHFFPLASVESSQWIADNLLMNYCLWNEDTLLLESFINNMNIPLQFNIEHFHFCITGLDNKFITYSTPNQLEIGINRVSEQYQIIQNLLTEFHFVGTSFLIKLDNSKLLFTAKTC